MLVELLVNAFIIIFVAIAAYGHVLVLKALLPGTWPWRKRTAGQVATASRSPG